MPFYMPNIRGGAIPHVFSRLDPVTKKKYKESYRKMKVGLVAGSMGTVTITGAITLATDVASSKIKAYAYSSLFGILLGPIMTFISLPMYVFSYGSFIRPIAVSVADIGTRITKGEMSIVNWSWVAADLSLFGETVPIVEQGAPFFLGNETGSGLQGVIDIASEAIDGN
jgi:uncharacterized membrane protein YvlD (DUF360 family)